MNHFNDCLDIRSQLHVHQRKYQMDFDEVDTVDQLSLIPIILRTSLDMKQTSPGTYVACVLCHMSALEYYRAEFDGHGDCERINAQEKRSSHQASFLISHVLGTTTSQSQPEVFKCLTRTWA